MGRGRSLERRKTLAPRKTHARCEKLQKEHSPQGSVGAKQDRTPQGEN